MARVVYWGNSYKQYAYSRQPTFPLFVAAARSLGIPYRLWIEMAWMLACTAAFLALRKCGLRPGLPLVAFGLILFDPLQLIWSNRLLPDVAYSAAYLGALAGVAGGLAVRRCEELLVPWSILACVTTAFAVTVRPESVLVYGLLGLTACIVIAQHRSAPTAGTRTKVRLIALVVAPLLSCLCLVQVYSFANLWRIGIYATSDLMTPGFSELYRSLLEIQPESPRLRVPIARDVREKAYAVSPSFAMLRPYLDGDRARPQFQAPCRLETGEVREYGAWMIWALRDASWRAHLDDGHPFSDASEMDTYWRRCAREIREAMRLDVLPHRWSPASFIPPEWGQLVRESPGVICSQFQALAHRDYCPDQPESLGPANQRLFDSIATRRSSLGPLAQNANATQNGPPNIAAVTKREKLKALIATLQNLILRIGAIFGVGGVIFTLLRWRPLVAAPRTGVGVLLLLLAGAFAGRCLLCAMLELCGILVSRGTSFDQPVTQSRYMLLLSPVAALCVVVGVDVLCTAALKSFFRVARARRLEKLATP